MPDVETVEIKADPEIQPISHPLSEVIVNVDDSKRPRNYSFKHRDPDSLDTVECNGVQYSIPATIGSCYWAVLKVCYQHVNTRVYFEALWKEVSELMMDRNPEQWQEYCEKEETTVFKKLEAKRDVQKISSWKDRIVNNAKTLTRLGGQSKYGQRLFEMGHVLRFEYDENQVPCFVLHTSLDVLNQPKKRKPKEKKAEKAE